MSTLMQLSDSELDLVTGGRSHSHSIKVSDVNLSIIKISQSAANVAEYSSYFSQSISQSNTVSVSQST